MNDLAERQQLLRDIRRVSRDLKTSIPETLPALQIILAQVQAARAVQDTILPSMDRFSSHADEILQLLEDIKLLVSVDPAPEPRTMRTSTEVTAALACQGAAYVDLHLGGGPSLVFGIIGPTTDEKERFDRFDGNWVPWQGRFACTTGSHNPGFDYRKEYPQRLMAVLLRLMRCHLLRPGGRLIVSTESMESSLFVSVANMFTRHTMLPDNHTLVVDIIRPHGPPDDRDRRIVLFSGFEGASRTSAKVASGTSN